MDGITLIQKSASAPPAMGMSMLMVMQLRGVCILQFSAICVVLDLVTILAEHLLTSLLLMV